jgi:hypothetical protein
MTTKNDKYDEDVQERAEMLADEALSGADLALGWRDAGYASARDRAEVLLGESLSDSDPAVALALDFVTSMLDEEGYDAK